MAFLTENLYSPQNGIKANSSVDRQTSRPYHSISLLNVTIGY